MLMHCGQLKVMGVLPDVIGSVSAIDHSHRFT